MARYSRQFEWMSDYYMAENVSSNFLKSEHLQHTASSERVITAGINSEFSPKLSKLHIYLMHSVHTYIYTFHPIVVIIIIIRSTISIILMF
jgi:hypothetical protein